MYVPVSVRPTGGIYVRTRIYDAQKGVYMYVPVSVRPTGGIYVRTHIYDTQKGVYMYVYTCICEAHRGYICMYLYL